MRLEVEGEEVGGQILPHFYCEDMMNVMNKVITLMMVFILLLMMAMAMVKVVVTVLYGQALFKQHTTSDERYEQGDRVRLVVQIFLLMQGHNDIIERWPTLILTRLPITRKCTRDIFPFAGEKKRGLVKVCWNHQGFYFDCF